MVARHAHERAALRRAGRETARLLADLSARARPGVTTGELDAFAGARMRELGAEPVFHTQNGFPGCINTSINDEAVHGVPGERALVPGDLLKIDCGMRLGGYCGDATITIGVGGDDRLSAEQRAVMNSAREALALGIEAVRVGGRIGDIGHAMQTYVEDTGFRLLPQYTGHGLGRRLWEPPNIPAVGRAGVGPAIVEGMVFTIEPIVSAGSGASYVAADGWTVVTVEHVPAAQFEHTVIATRSGAEILSAA